MYKLRYTARLTDFVAAGPKLSSLCQVCFCPLWVEGTSSCEGWSDMKLVTLRAGRPAGSAAGGSGLGAECPGLVPAPGSRLSPVPGPAAAPAPGRHGAVHWADQPAAWRSSCRPELPPRQHWHCDSGPDDAAWAAFG